MSTRKLLKGHQAEGTASRDRGEGAGEDDSEESLREDAGAPC